MRGLLRKAFGARAQVVVGAVACHVSVAFWVLGTTIIPGAARRPWRWTTGAFIFHASMFALVLAAYAIMATGLTAIWLDKRTPDAE